MDEAVEFCRKNGIEFYAVNKSYPEEIFDEKQVSRKIHADVFIDDLNLGGFPGWGEVWRMLNPMENPSHEEEMRMLRSRKPNLLQRLKKLFY
jgi:hypothetical protein